MKKNKHTGSIDFKVSTMKKTDTPLLDKPEKNITKKKDVSPISLKESMKYSNNLPKKHLLDQPPKLNINNKSSVSSITDANSSSKFKKNVGSSNTSIINKLKNDSTPFYNNKSTNNKVTKLKLENEVVTNKSNNNLRININSSKINMQKNHSTNNNNIYSNQIKVPNRKNEITNKSQLRKEKELKDNYSNKDKNVNFNVSHQNFALNSDFVCELQKDLKTIEVEEGIYSKTFQKSSNNNRIISFENLDDKEILSISNIDLDKTNNLDDTEINVQMMYQSAQEKLTHPHHFFLEDSNLYLSEVNEKNEKNEKSKTMKKLNKHDTIICNQKNDSEIKFNQSNPEKNNKAVNLIDLSDKGKYSSNIINQTDNSDKNINLNNLIKNKNKRNLVNSESSNTNLNYDIKTKIVSNEENTTKSVKNSIINKLLPNHENSTELADFNKNDDLSNKNNKCLGQRIIEENSLTNIIEDTKELRGSSYFSNGGNFSIKDVNSIEVRSYIFNNNNNEEKSNKNLSEDKTKNILINDNIENLKENLDENDNIHAESILKEDISNIAADNSIYQQNEDFSKLLTYKKCVEILDNKPIINIDEKSNDQNIKIEIEAPSCASSSESVNNQLLVGNNEKIKITEIAKNAENSPNNNDLYNGKEYCLNEFPLKTDKQSLVKLLNYQEKEKMHDKDGKSKRTFDGLSENTAVNISITKQEDFLNKNTLEQKKKHCNNGNNNYDIEKSVNLQIFNNTENGSTLKNDDFLEEKTFNDMKNVFMTNDKIKGIPTKSVFFEPLSKNFLADESETNKNNSYQSRKQNIENFLEFFIKTISLVYFIFYIILVYKTQVRILFINSKFSLLKLY